MRLTTAVEVSDGAWAALGGAIDLHVHVAPDVIPRRIDDLDLAGDFLACGLKGFALKSHYFPTAERAAVVTKAVPGIAVYGTLALNHSVGGLNPVAVELAGRSGCRIVWMPTVDAANEAHRGGHGTTLPFWAAIQRELAATGITPPPLSVLDDEGCLVENARTCLELVAKYDMILATGHLSRREIFALVRSAREVNVQKIVVTHAEFPSQDLSPDEQAALADEGAMIEHCFTTFHTRKADWSTVLESINRVGAERSLLSTDLGQAINPPVTKGFGMFAQTLLDAGCTPAEVSRMAVANPGDLVS
jgi:hypothetical protein